MQTINYHAIKVVQTDWLSSQKALSEIRRQVFIKEQKVPPEDELDQHDEQAEHWLAHAKDDKPIGTARLVIEDKKGRIGRMAVLAEFRRGGVGAAILREIIQYAATIGLQQLCLNAQLNAEDFYRKFGFVPQGEAFMDAGIAHIRMQRDISYKPGKGTQDTSSNRPVDNLENCIEALEQLIATAQRQLSFFSQELPPAIYNHPEICRRLYQFALGRNTNIKIIVQDISLIKTTRIELVELAQRLPSHIHVRKYNDDAKIPYSDFIVQDKVGVLYYQASENFNGYYHQHGPHRAHEFSNAFDVLWENSLPDPEFRRLSL